MLFNQQLVVRSFKGIILYNDNNYFIQDNSPIFEVKIDNYTIK